jgi:hypothetical protein
MKNYRDEIAALVGICLLIALVVHEKTDIGRSWTLAGIRLGAGQYLADLGDCIRPKDPRQIREAVILYMANLERCCRKNREVYWMYLIERCPPCMEHAAVLPNNKTVFEIVGKIPQGKAVVDLLNELRKLREQSCREDPAPVFAQLKGTLPEDFLEKGLKIKRQEEESRQRQQERQSEIAELENRIKSLLD